MSNCILNDKLPKFCREILTFRKESPIYSYMLEQVQDNTEKSSYLCYHLILHVPYCSCTQCLYHFIFYSQNAVFHIFVDLYFPFDQYKMPGTV